MGVNFYWESVKPGRYLSVGARSRFLEILVRAFGESPWDFSAPHGSRLRDIALGADDLDIKKALNELADAINTHEQIRVWTKY